MNLMLNMNAENAEEEAETGEFGQNEDPKKNTTKSDYSSL
jgi:hypothetical protein